ncbi:GntR family transcriptional regulator [Prauserella marina]|uniref:DNA-binding transcriptional regulator, FadR family n=1 Tax=Prauserella marina TaxID=530584 RepID=A0A222VLS6_9PSEU|nr:FadR/GntR family transcriptional regulator [Prauserella marina]ASR34792.1 GntR family transcriptional regulator [Prauserella marina]PWV85523.1 GntR family transcriptional regulator [Prauserella marina]SDC52829.1 DNA-binding transcriptional regulator, FadR family [Prauserella marina]
MPLASTRRSGLVDQVIGQLTEAIRTGEWPVGERIPTEPELVAELEVGRNTVREAVRALAHGGLLEVRQGDGTYVRATSEVSGAVRKMCGTELREVLQVRKPLEAEGARLAATQRTDADVRELTRLLGERDDAWLAKDYETYVRVDADFHLAVVEASHNTLLAELYRGLTEVVTASVAATTRTEPAETESIGHHDLLAAIIDGDADRAAAEACGFLDELLARGSEEYD